MAVETLVMANLITQIVLLGVAIGSGYFARVRKDISRHCAFMRVAVALQVVAVVFIMAPSFPGQVSGQVPFTWFSAEVLLHAALGVGVIGIWVYANLVMLGIVRRRGRLLLPMRIATGMWIAAFVLGLRMYIAIWL